MSPRVVTSWDSAGERGGALLATATGNRCFVPGAAVDSTAACFAHTRSGEAEINDRLAANFPAGNDPAGNDPVKLDPALFEHPF